MEQITVTGADGNPTARIPMDQVAALIESKLEF